MSVSPAVEVNVEARRILAVSISKLYASRSQRGGLRLHRSLLLSMVMRSARDIYHSSVRDSEPQCEPMDTDQKENEEEEEKEEKQQPEFRCPEPVVEEPEEREEGCDEQDDDKENQSPVKQSRKRRGKTSATPDFLPSKRARLEPGEERYAAPPPCCCRSGVGESLSSLSLNRVIPAC